MNGLQLATRVAIIMAKTDPDRSQRVPQRLQDVRPAPDRTRVEADPPSEQRCNQPSNQPCEQPEDII